MSNTKRVADLEAELVVTYARIDKLVEMLRREAEEGITYRRRLAEVQGWCKAVEMNWDWRGKLSGRRVAECVICISLGWLPKGPKNPLPPAVTRAEGKKRNWLVRLMTRQEEEALPAPEEDT